MKGQLVNVEKGTMILKLKKPIFFVGMMGAGKTAVGRATADILGVPFLDSDAEIEYAANMSISEIFERDGEDYFREKEEQVIRRLCGTGPCVISHDGIDGTCARLGIPEIDLNATEAFATCPFKVVYFSSCL